MRRPLALAALLAATAAPAAGACTIDNCVEVRQASATWLGADTHELTGACAVAGRGYQRFVVAGEAHAHGESVAPVTTVRCTVYANGVLVFDDSATNASPVTAFAATFVSRANIRVCMNARADWPDGHSTTVADCS